jgi:peptidoglycan/LPS O-acetylase OafA/YrhL
MAPGIAVNPRAASPAEGRDRLVDALRGASALAVVLFHLTVAPYYPPGAVLPGLWSRLMAYGYLGVPVFFVLSGFCIGQSWRKSSGAGGFLRRRFWRIYPAYFASLLLSLGIILVRKWVHGINDIVALPATLPHVIATLTLWTDPASHYSTINWVYWSLTNEAFYYCVLGGLLWLATPRARGRGLLALHAALSALHLTGWNLHATPLFFVDHWDVFALGLAACLLAAGAPEAGWFLAISCGHMAALMVLGRCGLFEIIGLAGFALLLLPHARLTPRPSHPLVTVGRFSYSLYLIHVPVGVFVFMRHVAPLLAGSAFGFAFAQLAGLALVLCAAALFHRAIEKPFLSAAPPSTV